jgi:predicted 3-demethylubiquinone-9 3-methyltransferase (glyoxalase superfamily)
VSFVVNCKDQKEVDYYWDALLAGGGQPSQCGWLKDKYGLSWQVVPKKMVGWWEKPDEKSQRAFEAMMHMGKLDIAALERAYNG